MHFVMSNVLSPNINEADALGFANPCVASDAAEFCRAPPFSMAIA
jgi:hypothetical protein